MILEFAAYFESQNAAIASGSVTGQNVSLVALGINNGWFDPIIQEKAYVDFSYNNTYTELISASQHTSYLNTYTTKCLPLLQKCASTTGGISACETADSTCYNDIEGPLSSVADFDVYDIRAPSNDPNPPETYVTYLQSSAVMSAIGAESTYAECPDAPYEKFASTGDGTFQLSSSPSLDHMEALYIPRDPPSLTLYQANLPSIDARSFLSTLSTVVQSGITTLIWAGDADWICNWFGGLASAEAIVYSGSSAFKSKAVSSYTVNGVAGGTFKSVGNLSWLRVFGAGHEVPYYQPALALQAFKQTMMKGPIAST